MIPRRTASLRSLPGNIIALVVMVTIMMQLAGNMGPATVDSKSFPPLTGRVVDSADILDPATEARLDGISADLEQKTQAQLVVATIPDLGGADIAEYGYQLGRAWGIGRKGVDDGVLLLVAPGEREVRIEVGYGLEGTLTDARSRQIIERDIVPAFKTGNMAEGVLKGAQSIAALAATSETAAPSAQPVARAQRENKSEKPNMNWLGVLLLGLFGLLPLGGIAQCARCFISPAYGETLVPVYRNRGGRGGRGGGPGSSGGGRGFSGGGGRFGGGGASGRW